MVFSVICKEMEIFQEYQIIEKIMFYTFHFLLGYIFYEHFKEKILVHKRICYFFLLLVPIDFICVYFIQEGLIFDYILSIIGSLEVIVASKLICISRFKSLTDFLGYIGRNSLQFYLFAFGYPIIRVVMVSFFKITDPLVLVPSIFILQIISTILIVEFLRRIRILRIPCGF